jgi:broad specificity phosphatase PhoE
MERKREGTGESSQEKSDGSERKARHREREFWIIRHGQRVDEAPSGSKEKQLWKSKLRKDASQWHDPPLTARGKQQAKAMAKAIAQDLLRATKDAREEAYIACSPFKRALQTAEALSAATGIPIRTIASVGLCTAAAKRHGMALVLHPNGKEKQILFNPSEPGNSSDDLDNDHPTNVAMLDAVGRAALCPDATWVDAVVVAAGEEDMQDLIPPTEACQRFGAPGSGCVVVVAHRELMYDYFDMFQAKFRGTPAYCSVLKLQGTGSLPTLAAGNGRWRIKEAPAM